MPKGISKGKTYTPGEYAHNRAWQSHHYKKKGLSFEDWLMLAKSPCYYCGVFPKMVNPFGKTFEVAIRHNLVSSFQTWLDGWIYLNGVDKLNPSPDYSDLSNLVSCCHTCNFMKCSLGKEQFLSQIKRIHAHLSL